MLALEQRDARSRRAIGRMFGDVAPEERVQADHSVRTIQ
jgi:hypothetical protein